MFWYICLAQDSCFISSFSSSLCIVDPKLLSSVFLSVALVMSSWSFLFLSSLSCWSPVNLPVESSSCSLGFHLFCLWLNGISGGNAKRIVANNMNLLLRTSLDAPFRRIGYFCLLGYCLAICASLVLYQLGLTLLRWQSRLTATLLVLHLLVALVVLGILLIVVIEVADSLLWLV